MIKCMVTAKDSETYDIGKQSNYAFYYSVSSNIRTCFSYSI